MFLSFIVPISILIPIIFGLLNYKSANDGHKILIYYLITSGLINFTAIILAELGIRNLLLLHLYTIIEAVLILSYLRTLFKQPHFKKLLLIIIVCFPILCILNFVFLQSMHSFNTHTRPLEAILVTFCCLLYLYKSGFTENWIGKPTSWFNIGILIYFPAACIIFIVSNYMVFITKDRTMNLHVWKLHATLVLVMYLVWSRGFYLLKNGR